MVPLSLDLFARIVTSGNARCLTRGRWLITRRCRRWPTCPKLAGVPLAPGRHACVRVVSRAACRRPHGVTGDAFIRPFASIVPCPCPDPSAGRAARADGWFRAPAHWSRRSRVQIPPLTLQHVV